MTDAPLRPAVVDASVAVKWVLDEAYADLAVGLYARSVLAKRPLLAPVFLPNEVTNAIFRQYRRDRISEIRADAAVARFFELSLDLQFVNPLSLAQRAYTAAKRHRLGAIYDSLYVVLAEEMVADLWTDDRHLVIAVALAAPWVRWIGDYPAAGP